MLIAGIVCLLIGFVAVRGQLSPKIDSWPVLGRVFFAAPLAVFGVQHFAQPQAIMQLVPAFMPARLFWVYLVGSGLLAAAVSIASGKYLRLSGTLLGLMWLGFVLMIHIPNVAAQPTDRFLWAIAARDLSFGVAAWSLAGGYRVTTVCRIVFAVLILFFGIEHLLHPEFAPGVPLEIMTPEWIPARPVWGYALGAILLATGVALLINWHTRIAATSLGVAVTVVVVIINLPALLADPQPWVAVKPIDVVFDTLLFAGSAFLVALALPGSPEARVTAPSAA